MSRKTRNLVLIASIALARSAASQGGTIELPSTVVKDGGEQYDLASADFDGDGRVEAVIAEQNDSVSVVRFDARARVLSRTILPTANAVDCVATGDVNGDGNADIVAVEWGSGSLARSIDVWLGDGHGGFSALPPQPGGFGDPWRIALAETTGDGKLDLFWGGPCVFAGDGAGHFNLISFVAGFGDGNGMCVGDFDEDGLADVAYGMSMVGPSATVALSDGAGGFHDSSQPWLGAAARDVKAFDLNGDGHLDLFFADDDLSKPLQVAFGDGHGGFQTVVGSVPGLEMQRIAVADLDGDGIPEVIALRPGSSVAFELKHIGGGKFTAIDTLHIAEFSDRPLLADFDGDGRLDFASIDTFFDGVQITRQLGAGVFDHSRSIAVAGSQFEGLAIGDVNGDGIDDIVAANHHGTGIDVLLGSKVEGSLAVSSYSTAVGPRDVALGDLDEDGKLDAVVGHDGFTCVAVLHGTGTGAFGAATLIPTVGKCVRVVLGDFDGDHHLDAAIALQAPDGVAIFLGDGTGALALHATIPSAGVVSSLAIGDFDGDAQLDLVVAADALAPLTLFTGLGNGDFAPGVALPAAASAVVDVAAGDVDGDGDLDLVVAHSSGTLLEQLISDGHGSFSPIAIAGFAGTPSRLVLRDSDGDGDADLFVLSTSDATFGVMLGGPSGVSNFASSFRSAVDAPDCFAVGDFDADGKPDVATGGGNFSSAIGLSLSHDQSSGTSIYCAAKPNSLNCYPSLDFSGTPSVSESSGFTIRAHDVLSNKLGLFFYSLVGPNDSPFQGGTYCVKPPTKRCAPQLSGGNPPPLDCSGVYSIDFNAEIALGHDANLIAGTAVYGQFWSRDPGFSAPNNTGLTNAIRFVITP